ncbi:leucyl aminopeptidase family protein [Lichenicola sp.]|uniref:leucyl aminopeptidase family protein n=1 Tax=Lichenicola sp. TaxID=2804529 RepID=UPI003B007EF6
MFDRPLDCLITSSALAPDQRVRDIHAVRPEGLPALPGMLGAASAAWLTANGFRGRAGELVKLPGPDGIAAAVLGLGPEPQPSIRQSPHPFGSLAAALADQQEDPETGGTAAVWRLLLPAGVALDDAVLGFCLGAYRFDRLRSKAGPDRVQQALLLLPADEEAYRSGAEIARATWLARDLINMPANLLGPLELAEAAQQVMRAFGADAQIIAGDDLAREYPAVAAVGAGSVRPPQVLVARWRGSQAGDDAPLLSLVGKGVCFDTGGYDIKPSAGMLRMKKDMGGAAIMLALARLVMAHDLPVRLELRLGCVENSISGSAMRPSDVIRTRRGLSVEIGNTDAEGRLVLCDLLAEASDAAPDLLLDAATLTGAARTALGPDLPALFCNDESTALHLGRAGLQSHDPIWRLPLWGGYDDWLSSPIADLNNVSSKPMAGSITASLFLHRFVAKSARWAHLDTYAWNDQTRAGRPEGGEALGLRAMFHALLPILNLRPD